jgi:hypothetical protein
MLHWPRASRIIGSTGETGALFIGWELARRRAEVRLRAQGIRGA